MSTKPVKHGEPQAAGAPVTADGISTPNKAPAAHLSKTEQTKILDAAARLTPRQRQLIYYLTEGMSLTEATQRAGYADGGGSSALASIKEKMPAIMDRLGLADEALIEKYLMPLLVAEETKFFQFKGEVVEERNVQALDIRLRALDLACKLKGRLTPEPAGAFDDHSITVNIVHVGGGA